MISNEINLELKGLSAEDNFNTCSNVTLMKHYGIILQVCLYLRTQKACVLVNKKGRLGAFFHNIFMRSYISLAGPSFGGVPFFLAPSATAAALCWALLFAGIVGLLLDRLLLGDLCTLCRSPPPAHSLGIALCQLSPFFLTESFDASI